MPNWVKWIIGIGIVYLILRFLGALFGFKVPDIKSFSGGIGVSGDGGNSSDNVFAPMLESEFASQTEYWKAISKMETAGYTSRICLDLRNMFGMKHPRERTTTSTKGFSYDSNPGVWWATYPTYQESVQDIVYWLRARKSPEKFNTLYDCISFMGSKGYFGEESVGSYFGKVMAWVNR